MAAPAAGGSALSPPSLRRTESVSPLELFFDLVFVLAITQCTALMAERLSWTGIGEGLVVLGLLWWTWGGYTWLTSVLDPEEGAVRIVLFASMAALLVAALCVPGVFDESRGQATAFVAAYGVVRAAHIALFVIAGRGQRELLHSVFTLGASTTVGLAILLAGSRLEPDARLAVWSAALVVDMGGPFFFGAGGWQLEPHHFAERHGLIVLIALGESIVAIGVGAEAGVDGGIAAAAVLGIALAATMWWAYFDVVALVATRTLAAMPPGKERNERGRDSYSYIHFPMVAAIVLVALGMKHTLAHVDEPLDEVAAAGLVGGLALYLLAHVAFRLRNGRGLNGQRLVTALVLLAFAPFADEPDALVTLAAVAAVAVALITYEAIRYAGARHEVRHST